MIRAYFFILLTISSPTVAALEDPRSQKQFYVETYGLLDTEQTKYVKRVESIFERLLEVVDRAKPKNPSLKMVDTAGWPWAIALTDNTVILTKGAIDLCYENVSLQQGDARVAMLLGHELTHLSENDYWQREVYLLFKENNNDLDDKVLNFMRKYSGLGNQTSEQWQDYVRNKEIKADDMGFIYASLAGFDTSTIIDTNGESFFHYWKNKTGVKDDAYHFSVNLRTDYIKARFENLKKLPELFYIGLAFIHLGYLDQAKQLFDQIHTQFPSHLIYNNLGYIYLHKSRILSQLSEEDVFWLPVILDGELKAPVFSRGDGSPKLPAETKLHLENAARQFELAISKRPGYLIGMLNLATTYFYLDKYHKAYALLKDAKLQYPENQKIDELLTLSLYQELENTSELSSHLLNDLEDGFENNNETLSRLFNLARLHELSGNKKKAQAYWKRLSELRNKIVEPYKTIVMNNLDNEIANNIKSIFDKKTLIPHQCQNLKTGADSELLTKLGDEELYKIIHNNVLKEYRTNTQSFFTSCVLPTEELKQVLIQCCESSKRITKTANGEIMSISNKVSAFITDTEQSEIWFR